MKITEVVKDKRILLWGYGREGKAMERFLKNKASVRGCTVYEGGQDGIDTEAYDFIIKSPGIVADARGSSYTSMTELFLGEFAKQTIGVTGTKGKSTVTSLLYEVLFHELKRKVLLVGNMGLPCLNYYDEIDEDTVILFEMSCHQLQYLTCSPHVAVFLNLFPEHLDHYGTMEKYTEAKMNITKWQEEDDFLFVGEQLRGVESRAKKVVIPQEVPRKFELRLKGKHNQFNAQVVYTISTELFGCDGERVRKIMSGFSTLRHRLECVGTFDGIEYYDDSIATIPEATIQAAGSVPNAKTLLIGGMDRNIPYDVLEEFIGAHPGYNYILMYASGKRIYGELADVSSCHYCEDLKEAVELAKKITKRGEACILSPAAASYGYFADFQERGDVFRELVKSEKR
ncbi:MAG: UDP-N-acetylmuramoyl-L-alanine--D-glutamate ligase [bacterium]|nr:UDP-N-acetylmuramoyl-L-alanine--D-glutamate ligase [bacterium]